MAAVFNEHSFPPPPQASHPPIPHSRLGTLINVWPPFLCTFVNDIFKGKIACMTQSQINNSQALWMGVWNKNSFHYFCQKKMFWLMANVTKETSSAVGVRHLNIGTILKTGASRHRLWPPCVIFAPAFNHEFRNAALRRNNVPIAPKVNQLKIWSQLKHKLLGVLVILLQQYCLMK